MEKKQIVKLALGIILGVLLGVGSLINPISATTTGTAHLQTLKMTYVTWVGCGPLFIAKEKGYFAKYGVNPELVLNEDETQIASLLFSNSIQAASDVIDKSVLNHVNGTGEKIVLIFDESSGGDGIIATANIKSVNDLKGKHVALDKASTSYYFFSKVLKDYKITPKEVIIEDMGASDGGAAFLSGKVDAAVVWEPWLTKGSKRKGAHILLTSRDYPRTIMDALSVSKPFYEKHPESVTGLKKAWCDAVDYYKKHPDEGNKIMAKGLNISLDEFKSEVKGVTFFDKHENDDFFNKSSKNNIYEVAQSIADFWEASGATKKKPDISGLFQ